MAGAERTVMINVRLTAGEALDVERVREDESRRSGYELSTSEVVRRLFKDRVKSIDARPKKSRK